MNEIYFDNAASTKVAPEIIEIINKTMLEEYANPHAKHLGGMRAENYVKEASLDIAKILKVEEKEIIFTSGGTESNNMAIMGICNAYKRDGQHIITSSIEHPSVYEVFLHLEKEGYEVSVIGVDKDGHINLEELKDSIREDTILVSIMQVNNEMGALQDLQTISNIIKTKNKNTIFHVDSIQGFGKEKIQPKKLGVDMLSVSGHKLHAPKGIGFLYIDKSIKMLPIIYGGGHQGGLRSGTLNVPGIIGIAKAAKLAYENLDTNREYIAHIKDFLIDGLSDFDGVIINSKKGFESAINILSISVVGVKSEVLLHALEDKGIYVSSGSACSSNHPKLSGTLKAIGLDNSMVDSTIRVSLSKYNTIEEAQYFIKVFKELLPILRRYTKR